MINDLQVIVNKKTRFVNLPRSFIGNDGENLESKITFTFEDEFVNGQARLEYELENEKKYIVLQKDGETYSTLVKNVLTKEGNVNMQLVIDEDETNDGVPIFKSNLFYFYCGKSLNAVGEAPDSYELWIEQADIRLNQMDNFDISASKEGTVATVSVTNRFDETTTVNIYDGEKGDKGDSGIVTFEIDNNGHLIATATSTSDLENYSIVNGHLYLTIGGE